MSFTVVIKNNENGEILFASEKTKALVIGVVAEIGSAVSPAAALTACDTGHADMALAIGLARKSIESVEKKDPELKILSHAAGAFLSVNKNEQKHEDGV